MATTESCSSSWTDVVINGSAVPIHQHERQEFRWKTVKKGRLRPSAAIQGTDCDRRHCPTWEDSCARKDCIARISRQRMTTQAENIALTAAVEARLNDLDQVRQEIDRSCKTENFFSDDMEVSRLAVVKAKNRKTLPIYCGCSSCQLTFHQDEAVLLNECLSAAQHRLKVLREFRIANDKEAMHRTSTHFNKGNKYFTPVGSSKSTGVSALKPALQMQSSYDVAALTTNSMAARPLKVAWKDKPKAASNR